MMKKYISTIAIVVSVLFAGCSIVSVEESAKPDVSLTNTYFKVISLEGAQIEVFEREPFIQFEADGGVKGHLGCNDFFGSFKTEGKKISFIHIGSTKMMCPNLNTEDAFSQVLYDVKMYKIEGESLIFYNNDGEVIARFQAVYF
ncbi:MAG: META domain-containing protein [Sulfurimonadaceae bacterium]|nr:META domain-containing protein [Sulfurimonadaceae bacterium]